MRKAIALLLIGTLVIWPMTEAVPQEGISKEPALGKVIVLSEKVGETIDVEERNYYRLFLASTNFQSAMVLQRPDSSYVLQITEEMEGTQKTRTIQLEGSVLAKLRTYIDTFEEVSPSDTLELSTSYNDLRKLKILNAQMKTKEQTEYLMKEKWTKERWREERSYDRGLSYSSGGALLGFTLGATAGMLIGKGFQGKKVRHVIHEKPGYGQPDEWGYSPPHTWTENFYSYEHKNAPYWGAAFGGIAGASVGNFLGLKADKKYYLLVPRDIRTEKTKSSWFLNFAIGYGIVGPIVGGIAGWALYTPMKGIQGEEKKLDGDRFLEGYIVGAAVGTTMMFAFTGRAHHKRLWRTSLLDDRSESSLNIEFMPLDPTALSIHPLTTPRGETFLEYRMDLLRLRF